MKGVIVIAAALCLTACATSSAYGPKGSDGTGFTTQKVENDRFRISYSAGDEAQARDLALLRAAEVTTENGYDWFRVINGDLSASHNRRAAIRPRAGVGIGLGRGGDIRVRPRVNIGVGLGDVARMAQQPRFTSSLEIIAGRGEHPSDLEVYSAQEIMQNIRPDVFK